MIEVVVHTQRMMAGRIDIRCPHCKSVTACYSYASMVNRIKKCSACEAVLPDSITIYDDAVMRMYWHFYDGHLLLKEPVNVNSKSFSNRNTI